MEKKLEARRKNVKQSSQSPTPMYFDIELFPMYQRVKDH